MDTSPWTRRCTVFKDWLRILFSFIPPHLNCMFWFLCFNRLVDAHKELDDTKSKSATTLLATEDEILQLKAEWVMHDNTGVICSIQYLLLCWCELCLCFSLRSAHDQVEIYKRKLGAVDDYERQIRLLRDEVSYVSTEKAMLQER